MQPALAWYPDVLRADWATPSAVKTQFRTASILKDGRVVFNLAGNKYRLVVLSYLWPQAFATFAASFASAVSSCRATSSSILFLNAP